MPSGGWMIEYSPGSPEAWVEPIVGWALDEGGYVFAIVGPGGGYSLADRPEGHDFRIFHPEYIGPPVDIESYRRAREIDQTR